MTGTKKEIHAQLGNQFDEQMLYGFLETCAVAGCASFVFGEKQGKGRKPKIYDLNDEVVKVVFGK